MNKLIKRKIEEKYPDEFRKIGYKHLKYIKAIKEKNPQSKYELAKIIGISTPTCKTVLDFLHDQGIVDFEKNPDINRLRPVLIEDFMIEYKLTVDDLILDKEKRDLQV